MHRLMILLVAVATCLVGCPDEGNDTSPPPTSIQARFTVHSFPGDGLYSERDAEIDVVFALAPKSGPCVPLAENGHRVVREWTPCTSHNGCFDPHSSTIEATYQLPGRGRWAVYWEYERGGNVRSAPVCVDALRGGHSGAVVLDEFLHNVRGDGAASRVSAYRPVTIVSTTDFIPPYVRHTPTSGYLGRTGSLTLLCSDPSGCRRVAYSADGRDPTFEEGSGSFVVEGELTTFRPGDLVPTSDPAVDLRYVAEDRAGNISAIHHVPIAFDEDAPTVVVDPSGGPFTGEMPVQVTCSDTGGSGCRAISYTKDGSTPTFSGQGTVVTGATAVITVRCTTNLRVRALDQAGNLGEVQVVPFNNGMNCCTTTRQCRNETVCENVRVYPDGNTPGCWVYWPDGTPIGCVCSSGCHYARYEQRCSTSTVCEDEVECNY